MNRVAHRPRLRSAVSITGPAPMLTRAFREDPADWLPGPVPMRGAHLFHATLRPFAVPVTLPLLVGGSVIDGEQVSGTSVSILPTAHGRSFCPASKGI